MSRPHVVILLENLPVQRDRRVWREATALRDAGFRVTTICPRKPGNDPDIVVDDIRILSFVAPPERSGFVGFAWEYGVAFVQMARLLTQLRREGPIAGVQACNPPDIFFLHGLAARLGGARFVFDQHDLTPELYETRFGRRGPVHALLRWCERRTYGAADRVISTNETYRRAAIERGSLDDTHVVVVRNGPEPDTMRARPVGPGYRPAGADHLVVWMGNMGPQDGVDDAVRAVDHLVHRIGRTDTHVVFIGIGEAMGDAVELSEELGLTDHITFTGWIPDDDAFAWMSSADVGLSADPPGPLNDSSTMNKTLEYMSFGLPVVAHDLTETRVSAGDAGVYADTGDPAGLARCLDRLLDDPAAMERMGRLGRRRIEESLGWPHQRARYVELWTELLGVDRPIDLAHDDTDTAPVAATTRS